MSTIDHSRDQSFIDSARLIQDLRHDKLALEDHNRRLASSNNRLTSGLIAALSLFLLAGTACLYQESEILAADKRSIAAIGEADACHSELKDHVAQDIVKAEGLTRVIEGRDASFSRLLSEFALSVEEATTTQLENDVLRATIAAKRHPTANRPAASSGDGLQRDRTQIPMTIAGPIESLTTITQSGHLSLAGPTVSLGSNLILPRSSCLLAGPDTRDAPWPTSYESAKAPVLPFE